MQDITGKGCPDSVRQVPYSRIEARLLNDGKDKNGFLEGY
jgi:hypothetical protein